MFVEGARRPLVETTSICVIEFHRADVVEISRALILEDPVWRLPDPAAFVRRVNDLITAFAGAAAPAAAGEDAQD